MPYSGLSCVAAPPPGEAEGTETHCRSVRGGGLVLQPAARSRPVPGVAMPEEARCDWCSQAVVVVTEPAPGRRLALCGRCAATAARTRGSQPAPAPAEPSEPKPAARTLDLRPRPGNGRLYALGRLRRERPDLYALVLAGTLTAHGAMVAAGFRPRTMTLPVTLDGLARAATRHLNPSERRELARRLLADL